MVDPEENEAVRWDMSSTPVTLNPCGLGSMNLSKIWTAGQGTAGQRDSRQRSESLAVRYSDQRPSRDRFRHGRVRYLLPDPLTRCPAYFSSPFAIVCSCMLLVPS